MHVRAGLQNFGEIGQASQTPSLNMIKNFARLPICFIEKRYSEAGAND